MAFYMGHIEQVSDAAHQEFKVSCRRQLAGKYNCSFAGLACFRKSISKNSKDRSLALSFGQLDPYDGLEWHGDIVIIATASRIIGSFDPRFKIHGGPAYAE